MHPRLLFPTVGLLLLIPCLLSRGTEADDQPPTVQRPTPLFDGRTLEGWKPLSGDRLGKVSVESGLILLDAGQPMTCLTSTRGDLPTSNYSLTFEAKRTSGNDFFGAVTFPVGPSFVTLVPGGWGGSVTGLSMINGASASENETNHFVKYQNDVWYSFEVQVTDRVIRTLVDSVEVFTFNHVDTQLTTRLETRANQPLGFASYRSSSAIRKVQIKPLKPKEVAEVDSHDPGK